MFSVYASNGKACFGVTLREARALAAEWTNNSVTVVIINTRTGKTV